MKSYSEARGREPFDWNAFLNKGSFTELEINEAIRRSRSWIMCACGNQCDIIPRLGCTGEPIDSQLYNLGLSFTDRITDISFSHRGNPAKDIAAAKETLRKIEARSAFLIAEIQNQKP